MIDFVDLLRSDARPLDSSANRRGAECVRRDIFSAPWKPPIGVRTADAMTIASSDMRFVPLAFGSDEARRVAQQRFRPRTMRSTTSPARRHRARVRKLRRQSPPRRRSSVRLRAGIARDSGSFAAAPLPGRTSGRCGHCAGSAREWPARRCGARCRTRCCATCRRRSPRRAMLRRPRRRLLVA